MRCGTSSWCKGFSVLELSSNSQIRVIGEEVFFNINLDANFRTLYDLPRTQSHVLCLLSVGKYMTEARSRHQIPYHKFCCLLRCICASSHPSLASESIFKSHETSTLAAKLFQGRLLQKAAIGRFIDSPIWSSNLRIANTSNI